MSDHASIYTRTARWIAQLSGRPMTFMLAAALIVVWLVSGPIFGFSDTWQLVINTGTTIITFLMVFLIQNTQNRDGAAIHAKLDELVFAVKQADDRFIGIEHLTELELDAILMEVEARGLAVQAGKPARAIPGKRERAEAIEAAQPKKASPRKAVKAKA